MSKQKHDHRITAPDLAKRKGATPIVCLTAYTAPVAVMRWLRCDAESRINPLQKETVGTTARAIGLDRSPPASEGDRRCPNRSTTIASPRPIWPSARALARGIFPQAVTNPYGEICPAQSPSQPASQHCEPS